MSIEELYSLEVEGIAETINNYAISYYIKSYSKQLTFLKLPEDHSKIQTIINRLDEWYNQSFDSIVNSKFVTNKEEHKKTKELIEKLKIELNEYSAD